MTRREDVQYFGAGPAPLPTSVLEEASKLLLNYNESGVGITEISHRSAEANAILDHTKSALRQLLDIPQSDGPDGYEVLFLQGGGSGEFSAVVYHMVSIFVAKRLAELGGDATDPHTFSELESAVGKMRLDYLVTGSWSLKASQEAARLQGAEHVNIVVDARKHRDGKFGVIPDSSTWSPTNPDDLAVTYYCDNETVDGVEFQAAPNLGNLVADMSSNILSRPVDVKKHVAIFGGAQKNIGTTGITIAIVSNKILPPHAKMADATLLRKLRLSVGPVVLDWPTIAKNKSLYNTLPIFDTWIAGAVIQRLLDASTTTPKIATQQAESDHKAKLIYGVLDSASDVYQVVPDKSVRSRMNICFRVKNGDEAAEKELVKSAEQQGLLGIKGHRSVGGIRVSNYNAVPVAAVERLVRFLQDFAKS